MEDAKRPDISWGHRRVLGSYVIIGSGYFAYVRRSISLPLVLTYAETKALLVH